MLVNDIESYKQLKNACKMHRFTCKYTEGNNMLRKAFKMQKFASKLYNSIQCLQILYNLLKPD